MIKKILSFLFLLFVATQMSFAAQIIGIGEKCLDVRGGDTADGTPMILYKCHDRGKSKVENQVAWVGWVSFAEPN